MKAQNKTTKPFEINYIYKKILTNQENKLSQPHNNIYFKT